MSPQEREVAERVLESYGLSTSGKVHEVSSREYSGYEAATGKSAIADADIQDTASSSMLAALSAPASAVMLGVNMYNAMTPDAASRKRYKSDISGIHESAKSAGRAATNRERFNKGAGALTDALRLGPIMVENSSDIQGAARDLGSQILDMSDESFNQRIKSSSIAQRYEQDLRAYRKSGGANGDVLKRILAELGDKQLAGKTNEDGTLSAEQRMLETQIKLMEQLVKRLE